MSPLGQAAITVKVTPTLLSSKGGQRITAEAVSGEFYGATQPEVRFRMFKGSTYTPYIAPTEISRRKLSFETPPLEIGPYGFAVQTYDPVSMSWETVYRSSSNFFNVVISTRYAELQSQEFSFFTPDSMVSPLEYLRTTTRTATGVISNTVTVDRHVSDGPDILDVEDTGTFGYPWPLSEVFDEEIGGIIFTVDFKLDGKATYNFKVPFEVTFEFPDYVCPSNTIRFKARSLRFLGNDYLNVKHENYEYSTDHRLMVNVPYDGIPAFELHPIFKSDKVILSGVIPILPWESVSFGNEGDMLPALEIGDFSYKRITYKNGALSYVDNEVPIFKLQLGGTTQWENDAYNKFSNETGQRRVFAGDYREVGGLWSSDADQIWILSKCGIPYVSQACALLSEVGVQLPQWFSVNINSRDLIWIKPPALHGFEVTIPPDATNNPYHLKTNLTLTVSYHHNLFDYEVAERIYYQEVVSPLETVTVNFPIEFDVMLYGRDVLVEDLVPPIAAGNAIITGNFTAQDAADEQLQIARLSYPKPLPPATVRSQFQQAISIKPEAQFVIIHSNTPSVGGTLVLNPPPNDGGYGANQAVSFSAIPKAGYRFAGWDGALSGISSTTTSLVMSSNVFVNARFELALPLVKLVNSGFEADTFLKVPGYVKDNGPITGWSAWDYMGINPISPWAPTNNYFTDNGQIPEGRMAAFIQQDGALKQIVKGLVAGGTYRVDYFENARLHDGAGDPQLEVRMGGAVIVPAHEVPPAAVSNSYAYTFRESQPFVATTAEMELAFIKVGPAGLDRTVLIDDVRVVYLAPPGNRTLSVEVVPAGAGSVRPSPGSADGIYAAGTLVTLTATATSGYQFTGWSGDVSGSANPATLAMDGNKRVTANFATFNPSNYQPGLRRQIYTNILGPSVADLISSPKFPNAPDMADVISVLECQWLPDNAGENYGQRLSGWLVPPVTGDYVFYLASDDAGQLYLSADDTPADKRLIAEETAWSPWRNWEGTAGNPQRASASISLVAGRHYYLEVLHKEIGGGDGVAVAWKLPGGAAPKNGDPPIGAPYLVYQPEAPPETRPELRFTVSRLPGGKFQVVYHGSVGHQWRFEQSSDLVHWAKAAGFPDVYQAGTNGPAVQLSPEGGNTSSFIRARLVGP
jgi:hypothetical protein